MNSIRMQLVRELLQYRGGFVSGEQLSEHLDVSRTAIWKHIGELRKAGYVIEAVRKQGYKLISTPSALMASNIIPYLPTEWLGQHLHVYEQLESTQHVAGHLAREGAPSGTVVIADQQTAGKGTRGRVWHSPPGTGIWMSLLFRPAISLASVSQLTILASVATLKGIQSYLPSVDVYIKWPNDLLINGRKIAGILTELHAETDWIKHVIIGVGLNANQEAADYPEELRTKATSLRMETGEEIDRNQCIVSILKEWERIYQLYMKHGFAPIKTLWEANAVSLGEKIAARTMSAHFEGIARGITATGALLLEEADGTIQQIYSADIETVAH